jgi:branched-chain amino acid transport system substrate-binding protein
VTLPLTGTDADFGVASQQGVILAVQQINKSGGVNGHPLKVVYEDDKADPATAVTTFMKLTTANHVPAIISGSSGPILAQEPLASRNQVVLVNAGASTPKMRTYTSAFFVSVINDSNAESEDLMKYVKTSLHATDVVMVYSNEAIGQGARSACETAAKENGITISHEISLDPTNQDYSAAIAQLQSLKPAVVIAASYYQPVGFLLKQAGEAGFTTKWVGMQTSINPSALAVAGSAGNGYTTVQPAYANRLAATGSNKTKQFAAAFQKAFNTQPTVYSAHFYDATELLATVMRTAQSSDPKHIAKGLDLYKLSAHTYDGIAGPIHFDRDGIVRQPEYVFVVKNGNLVPVPSP